jgi:lysophospholipase L1-like esterase
VLIAAPIVTLTVPQPAGAAATSRPGLYVALGDSYTAGPFVPDQILGAAGCLRSDRNYPHLLASAIRPSALRDASCSGATISKLTRSQGVIGGTNAPQFSRLSPDTSLVTLQIGGNDVGFSDILLRCASLLPFGSPCKNHYVRSGVDRIANTINATAPRIASAIEGIRSRAPRARVFVLGYPAILPDSGRGCWPVMPFAWDDVPYLRARARQLNDMIAWQATSHHAAYVDVYTPSIGRDACARPANRWIEPLAPDHLAAPVHPNASGMKGMAIVTRRAMRL